MSDLSSPESFVYDDDGEEEESGREILPRSVFWEEIESECGVDVKPDPFGVSIDLENEPHPAKTTLCFPRSSQDLSSVSMSTYGSSHVVVLDDEEEEYVRAPEQVPFHTPVRATKTSTIYSTFQPVDTKSDPFFRQFMTGEATKSSSAQRKRSSKRAHGVSLADEEEAEEMNSDHDSSGRPPRKRSSAERNVPRKRSSRKSWSSKTDDVFEWKIIQGQKTCFRNGVRCNPRAYYAHQKKTRKQSTDQASRSSSGKKSRASNRTTTSKLRGKKVTPSLVSTERVESDYFSERSALGDVEERVNTNVTESRSRKKANEGLGGDADTKKPTNLLIMGARERPPCRSTRATQKGEKSKPPFVQGQHDVSRSGQAKMKSFFRRSRNHEDEGIPVDDSNFSWEDDSSSRRPHYSESGGGRGVGWEQSMGSIHLGNMDDFLLI